MSSNIYDFFTDVEVLKSREPEYFKCNSAVEIGDDSDEELLRVPCNANANRQLKEEKMQVPPSIVKTFVSILDEGCKKCYSGTSPLYSNIDCPDKVDIFTVRCELRDMVGLGRAKTKKAAKQLAAKEILIQVAEKEYYVEFGLGKTKQAAINYLNSLMPELSAAEEESEGAANENWIGKINEICQRLKLRAAIYEVEDRGTATQHLFFATCSICKLTTTGQGRTKKIAKMLAAQEMFKRLEENSELIGKDKDELPAMVQEDIEPVDGSALNNQTTSVNTFLGSASPSELEEQPQLGIVRNEVEEVEENSDDTRTMKIIREVLDPKATPSGAEAKLQQIVNAEEPTVEGIFAKQELSFTILKERDISGDVQCMLKVTGPNGEANVFGGTGQTEEASRDCAAHAAFVYLDTFMRAAAKVQHQ